MARFCWLLTTCLLVHGVCSQSAVVNSSAFYTVGEDLGIQYYIYTRDQPTSYVSELRSTDFDVNRPTVFLAHGFTGSADTTSVMVIKDALLSAEDLNVVSLHWEELAKGPDYEVAANNSLLAARHLATTIERLVLEDGLPLQSLHVIGFSLGAHVAGIAGGLLTFGKLPRITALDPAGPLFKKRSDEGRLDASDAEFVLVLHTSGGFVSFDEPLGHADFYPNGGSSPQPSCDDHEVELVCSHLIAPLYFAESVRRPRGFAGTSCGSWVDYEQGLCADRDPIYLGLHTPASARGSFFLRTRAEEPYGLGAQTGRESRKVVLEVQAEGSPAPRPLAALFLLLAACVTRNTLSV